MYIKFECFWWSNHNCLTLLSSNEDYKSQSYICFAWEKDTNQNCQTDLASDIQKKIAETLLAIVDNGVNLIKKVSFDKNGIGLTKVDIRSWETGQLLVENEIKKCLLPHDVSFN